MNHFEVWEHGGVYFPAGLFIFMILFMAACFVWFYRKRRVYFNRGWFRQNWSRDWFSNCYTGIRNESASEILKKRYARGDINKDEFEQMLKDISEGV